MTELMRKVPEGAKRLPMSRHPLVSLRREFDRLFDEFDGGFMRMPKWRAGFEPWDLSESRWDVAPPIDLVEKDQAYEITAELPGLERKDVEVDYKNGMLTLKGEKKEETEREEDNLHVSERRYGTFQRSFRVPESVNTDKIEATFKNGVLTVLLPKMPEAQGKEKKISVKAA